MANIFDVAKYILVKQGSVSTWKLQKLCYYAQAWNLAWEEKQLFSEDFEAWANGPVCRELYNKHRGEFMVDEASLGCGVIERLTPDEIETIDVVLETYGSKEAYWLREQTHSENPWKDARGDRPEGAICSNIIEKSSMGSYYGGL